MLGAVKNKISFVIDQLLFPPKCLKCGIYIDPEKKDPLSLDACFCNTCLAPGISFIHSPYCTKCGLQFFAAGSDDHVCENCIKTPLELGKVRACAQYRGVIKEAVHLLKYQSQLSVARLLEALLFQTFETHFQKTQIDVIMPIPLHKKRVKTRGFNQAFILVRNFAKFYEQKQGQKPPWQIDALSLIRTKKTDPQTGLDIAQRKANLKAAFDVVNKKAIENRHILLVDDVYTTGATCNEAAGVLLKHGASSVDALVLART